MMGLSTATVSALHQLPEPTKVDVPALLRGMPPVCAVIFASPASPIADEAPSTTLVVAPLISCPRGRGWELRIEALIPASTAPGTGVDVIAQLLRERDY